MTRTCAPPAVTSTEQRCGTGSVTAVADTEVLIVGAGLAGLACARTLVAAGVGCTVLEAGDDVGGRVRTDRVDGFRLDRGFQVLLTAYPEAHRQLDLASLHLGAFHPGALVQLPSGRTRVGDPLRRPGDLWSSATSPVGTVGDKARLLALLASVRRGPAADLLRRPDSTTLEHLLDLGFSARMIDRFFRPLLGGIQLDPDLGASWRMAGIVLRMLAEGASAVPDAGMGAIPAQLAQGLPPGTVRLGAEVAVLEGTTARLVDGGAVTGEQLVVAVEGPAAARLLDLPDPGSRPAGCLWFATEAPPVADPVLVLDGSGRGPVRNVAPMSVVAPGYAPPGRHLVAAAVPGPDGLRDGLVDAARRQLGWWFGAGVERWELLRVDRIPHGQPRQAPPLHPRQRVALGAGRFVCGDHRDTSSIQGALFSGRRTAEAILTTRR